MIEPSIFDYTNDDIDKYHVIRVYYKHLWLSICRCGAYVLIDPSDVTSKECSCKKTRSKRKWRSEKYKEWRQAVYKRDNYKCVICGSTHKLNAHHLYSYSNCKTLRYLVKNGVTLCHKHHEQFHYVFGKRYNTEEQFAQFEEALNGYKT